MRSIKNSRFYLRKSKIFSNKAEYITVAMVSVDESLTPEERLKQKQDAEKKAALKQLAIRQAYELQKLRQQHERQIAELTQAIEENHAALSLDN